MALTAKVFRGLQTLIAKSSLLLDLCIRVRCSFPVWGHTAPNTISRTLQRRSSVSQSAQTLMMEQGQASSWDMKQDELSRSSCQLPSSLLICWSMPRPAWNDADEGHHGWSYTLPDCYKIKAQCCNRLAPWKPTSIVSQGSNLWEKLVASVNLSIQPGGYRVKQQSKGKRSRNLWT